MSGNKPQKEFVPLQIAVVTVSDTRTEDTDTSGHYLKDALLAESHVLGRNISVRMMWRPCGPWLKA